MKARYVILFYLLVAILFIFGGLSLEVAPLADHVPVPRKLEIGFIAVGSVYLIAAALLGRYVWALYLARGLAGLSLFGLLNLLFHLRTVDLFSFLVVSFSVAFLASGICLLRDRAA